MTKVVGVRFSDTGKTYYFDPKGLDIKNGDEIIENCDSIVAEIDMDKEIIKKLVQLCKKYDKKNP